MKKINPEITSLSMLQLKKWRRIRKILQAKQVLKEGDNGSKN